MKGAADLFGAGGRCGIVAVGKEYDKFFAAETSNQVAGMAKAFEQLREAFNGFVAGEMAVSIVDCFEMIEIANDEAEWEPALAVGFEKQGVGAIEFRAVGQLREGIADGFFIQMVAAFFERGLVGGVVHQQGDALRGAIGADDGNDVQIDE